VVDPDDDDGSDALGDEAAAFLEEPKTRCVGRAVSVHGRDALEAIPLPQDGIDDVDLHDAVPGGDVGNRLRRM
jgi:hypothetical protein